MLLTTEQGTSIYCCSHGFSDGRKYYVVMIEEYEPIASTVNQLLSYNNEYTKSNTWGGSPVNLLEPPQLAIMEDVAIRFTAAQDSAEGEEFDSQKLFKVMQRWVPLVSNVDDFLRYFNDGERLLTEE